MREACGVETVVQRVISVVTRCDKLSMDCCCGAFKVCGRPRGGIRNERSDISFVGSTWIWVWGTSYPAMMSPTRSGENALLGFRNVMGYREEVLESSGSRSTQWSTSAIGTTRACPCDIGLIDINATHLSSRQINVPGMSSMIRVKIVATLHSL